MGENRNYQKELDGIIKKLTKENETKTLLLHSCCAPCSSYVLEYLSEYFKITVFYYNPNIYPKEEYEKRVIEQKNFINKLSVKNKISFIEGNYDTNKFFEMAKGLENVKEGGERCYKCYELRLKETALIAQAYGFDYYTTTLSISPYKNAKWINEIGEKLVNELDLNLYFLNSDFKKKNGYKRSIELSNEYNLYRQNYCGCIYSKLERERVAGNVNQ